MKMGGLNFLCISVKYWYNLVDNKGAINWQQQYTIL